MQNNSAPVVEAPRLGPEAFAAAGRGALRPPRPLRGGAHVVGQEIGRGRGVKAVVCKKGRLCEFSFMPCLLNNTPRFSN